MTSSAPTTRPVAPQHAFDADALAAWLRERLDGFDGPLQVEQFSGGQSNPTFRLRTPAGQWVMRAKPGPVAKLLPSAHAIEREYRVMGALAATEVPVPRMLLLCEDEAVIGVLEHAIASVKAGELHDAGGSHT